MGDASLIVLEMVLEAGGGDWMGIADATGVVEAVTDTDAVIDGGAVVNQMVGEDDLETV